MSNYPPGVTGTEPQITGEPPVDPHAPWVEVEDVDADPPDDWGVMKGNDYGTFEHVGTMASATVEAERRNRAYKDCIPVTRSGITSCGICGDVMHVQQVEEADQ